MKKLLALVLCVMLFVSVIPTAAFAASSAGSGVDLSPAYAAMQKLNIAYAQLAAATAYKNAIEGLKKLDKDGNMTEAINKLIEALKNVTSDVTTGLDYAGLAKLVGPVLIEGYNIAGNAIVADSAAKIQKTIDSVDKSVAAIVASFA